MSLREQLDALDDAANERPSAWRETMRTLGWVKCGVVLSGILGAIFLLVVLVREVLL